MKKFGLIGFPLGHSFSEKYFSEKFEKAGTSNKYSYSLFSLENIKDFPKILAADDKLYGINVTIPHKIEVMEYLNDVDEAAKEIGAVNCIKIVRYNSVNSLFSGELCTLKSDKPKLIGYNTDAYGFEASITPLLESHHQKALILGNGGAAKAIKYVLGKLGIAYKFVSRNPTENMFAYADLNEAILNEYHIIVNTSPVGTYPKADFSPNIPYQLINQQHLLYDLVYNPAETVFLKEGRERGAKTKNGYQMLVLQAEKSWEIWNS